jgi:NTE family protein
LAGGAARGAYEVGVVMHILTEVVKDIGRQVPFDILCGTSVGAINACTLATHADQPLGRGEILVNNGRTCASTKWRGRAATRF